MEETEHENYVKISIEQMKTKSGNIFFVFVDAVSFVLLWRKGFVIYD